MPALRRRLRTSPIVAQIGRGIKAPFQFVNGGVAWNLPPEPSRQDIKKAAAERWEQTMSAYPGETIGDRYYGAGLEGELQTLGSAARRDQIGVAIEE